MRVGTEPGAVPYWDLCHLPSFRPSKVTSATFTIEYHFMVSDCEKNVITRHDLAEFEIAYSKVPCWNPCPITSSMSALSLTLATFCFSAGAGFP